MPELHGAIFLKPFDARPLMKQLLLFFDKLNVLRAGNLDQTMPEEQADFDYLESRGFLHRIPHDELDRIFATDAWILDSLYGPEDSDDYISRHLAARIEPGRDNNSVGICLHPFPRAGLPPVPEPLKPFLTAQPEPAPIETTLKVTVEAFPVPSEMCAWQDILDFKAELRSSHWGFRRFIKTLATKPQSESEIRDDIEYTIDPIQTGPSRQQTR